MSEETERWRKNEGSMSPLMDEVREVVEQIDRIEQSTKKIEPLVNDLNHVVYLVALAHKQVMERLLEIEKRQIIAEDRLRNVHAEDRFNEMEHMLNDIKRRQRY